MRRRGHTYRIHDFGPFTIACAGSWVADGSHRWPVVDLIFRDRWSRPSCTGVGRATIYRRLHIPLPYIRWRTSYRFPILRPIQRRFDRFYRWAFVTRSER